MSFAVPDVGGYPAMRRPPSLLPVRLTAEHQEWTTVISPPPIRPGSVELRAFRATLVGTLITSAGLGLTLPFTFVYFDRILGLPLPVVGVVVAATSVLALVASGAGGVLADRSGSDASPSSG